MTKPKPRCIDYEGKIVVPPHRPLGDVIPSPRPWDAKDRRKLAQGYYNARSTAKITLPAAPWAKKEDV